MTISIKLIQKLRKMTGVGMMDCQRALEASGGDLKKAQEILKKEGKRVFVQKQEREAKEGVIGSYVHRGGKLASLIKIYCETDFVARNQEFKELAHDLAMQVLAAGALYLRPEDIPQKELEKQRRIILEEWKGEKKPQETIEKIIEGKLKKYQEEISLVSQPYFKNPEMTVQDLIQEKTLKLGEKIEVGEFVRFQL